MSTPIPSIMRSLRKHVKGSNRQFRCLFRRAQQSNTGNRSRNNFVFPFDERIYFIFLALSKQTAPELK